MEKEVTLSPGESAQIEDFTLVYQGLDYFPTVNREVISATLDVYDGNQKKLTVLTPAKTFQGKDENGVSEVSVRTTLTGDLYTILTGWDDKQQASFKFIINPMVSWIWLGGLVLIIGTTIAFWPDAREAKRDAIIQAEARVAVREVVYEA